LAASSSWLTLNLVAVLDTSGTPLVGR